MAAALTVGIRRKIAFAAHPDGRRRGSATRSYRVPFFTLIILATPWSVAGRFPGLQKGPVFVLQPHTSGPEPCNLLSSSGSRVRTTDTGAVLALVSRVRGNSVAGSAGTREAALNKGGARTAQAALRGEGTRAFDDHRFRATPGPQHQAPRAIGRQFFRAATLTLRAKDDLRDG